MMLGIQWGDFPGWVEALATVAAFGAVAFPLYLANNDRHRAQALSVDYCLWAKKARFEPPVFMKMTGRTEPLPPRKMPDFELGVIPEDFGDVYLTILNSSATSIHEVVIATPLWASKTLRIGKVPPGYHTRKLDELVEELRGKAVDVELGLYMPFMQFIDRDNRAWQRNAAGELKARTRKYGRI